MRCGRSSGAVTASGWRSSSTTTSRAKSSSSTALDRAGHDPRRAWTAHRVVEPQSRRTTPGHDACGVERNDPENMQARIWDWERGEEVATIDTSARRVAFDPTGTRIATSRLVEGIVDVWDAQTFDRLATLTAPTAVSELIYGPDGTSLATGHADGTVRLWDPETGTQRLELPGDEHQVIHVVFGPDGSKLASVGEDGLVHVWALELDDLTAMATERLTRDAQRRRVPAVPARRPLPRDLITAGRGGAYRLPRICHAAAGLPPPPSRTLAVSHHRCRRSRDTRSQDDAHRRGTRDRRNAESRAPAGPPKPRTGVRAIVGWAAVLVVLAAQECSSCWSSTTTAERRGPTSPASPRMAASAPSSTVTRCVSKRRRRRSPNRAASAPSSTVTRCVASGGVADGRRSGQHPRRRAP